jgi:cAMP-specific phosphodiesterase 4
LHVSDISNPFKPFNISLKWSNLVMEEFCLQGDREKREGLEVSPMMDRDLINLCNMQLGFIEFVVTPLISTVINLFPPLYEIG